MIKKELISDFRNALKNGSLDAPFFREFCENLRSPSVTEDEIIKIFSKTAISNIVCLENAEIICILSSFFWESSIHQWEIFKEVCKKENRINTHEIYNELIKYGDARMMQIVEMLEPNFVEIGTYHGQITQEFARKIADYRGKVILNVPTITPEVARILSHKKGAIDIRWIFGPFYSGEMPNWSDYNSFFYSVITQNERICFRATGITAELAGILGYYKSNTLELSELERLTVGIAKALSKSEDLRIGHSGSLQCDPGALKEFKNSKGELSLGGVISDITVDDAEALGCYDGWLTIHFAKLPNPKALEGLMKKNSVVRVLIPDMPREGLQPPLTPDYAEIISNFKGESLTFAYDGEISVECADKLSKLGSRLSLRAFFSTELASIFSEAGVEAEAAPENGKRGS